MEGVTTRLTSNVQSASAVWIVIFANAYGKIENSWVLWGGSWMYVETFVLRSNVIL